mgnify:CR=1 FL=1
MDNLIIEGKIVQILEPQSGTSTRGAWKKQDFVLETTEQYPKKICISCWNDKADEIANYKPNDMLKVAVNIESREYNTKWYTDIKAWKIEIISDIGSAPNAPNTNFVSAADNDITGINFSSDEGDDLPF